MSVPSTPYSKLSQKRQRHIIITTRLCLDERSNLIFRFDTDHDQFGLFLPMSKDLSWMETQAVVDATRITRPGQTMTTELFSKALHTLEFKYGATEGPIRRDDGRLCASFYPVRTILPDDPRDTMIVSTMFRLVPHCGRFVVLAYTRQSSVYSVRICTRSTDGLLIARECAALIGALTLLEPGNIVNRETFECFARVQQRRQCSVRSTIARMYNLHVTNLDIIPPFVHVQYMSGSRQRIRSRLWSTFQIPLPVSSTDHSLLLLCPYPGFHYTRLLVQSELSDVYEGVRDVDGTKVSIKVFHLESDTSETYKTELQLLRKMAPHPNVGPVIDIFNSPEPALIMSFISGTDISETLRKQGAFDQYAGITIAVDIANGLYHLHKHGILHRKLEPTDVILSSQPDGPVKPIIIGLGLSCMWPRMHTNRGTYDGKHFPLEMAPETVIRHQCSDKSDVYKFGMLFYEMLSGKRPFLPELGSNETHMSFLVNIANGLRPDLSHIPRSVDIRFHRLLAECWEKSPEKRPSTKRLLGALEGADPRVIFHRYSMDYKGKMQYEEFVAFLHFYSPEYCTSREISVLFELIDQDRSGVITFIDFECLWRQIDIAGIDAVIGRRKLQILSGTGSEIPYAPRRDNPYQRVDFPSLPAPRVDKESLGVTPMDGHGYIGVANKRTGCGYNFGRCSSIMDDLCL